MTLCVVATLLMKHGWSERSVHRFLGGLEGHPHGLAGLTCSSDACVQGHSVPWRYMLRNCMHACSSRGEVPLRGILLQVYLTLASSAVSCMLQATLSLAASAPATPIPSLACPASSLRAGAHQMTTLCTGRSGCSPGCLQQCLSPSHLARWPSAANSGRTSSTHSGRPASSTPLWCTGSGLMRCAVFRAASSLHERAGG